MCCASAATCRLTRSVVKASSLYVGLIKVAAFGRECDPKAGGVSVGGGVAGAVGRAELFPFLSVSARRTPQ